MGAVSSEHISYRPANSVRGTRDKSHLTIEICLHEFN
jgi:hypothetical protein